MDKNVKHYPLAHDVEMPQHCAYVVRDLPQAIRRSGENLSA